MYTKDEIRRGLQHPQLIRNKFREILTSQLYKKYNLQKEWKEREKKSNYGIVINWGLHRLDNWTAANYPYFVKSFVERFDPIIITSQRVYERNKNQLDYIFAFGVRNNKGPRIQYDISLNQTIAIFASDPHNRPSFLYKYIEENEVNHILTPFYNPLLYHLPNINENKVIHFPWPIPDEHVIDPASIDYRGHETVHISGAGGSKAYELRDWCRQQSDVTELKNSGTQNKIMSSDKYYLFLRNFDAAIAAGSLQEQWQYVVPKYYEIPASGTLLFAQYCKDFERLGFDESNSVIFHSKEEFKEKLESYLDEPKTYIKRRRRGAELIASKYTVSERLDDINRLFDKT